MCIFVFFYLNKQFMIYISMRYSHIWILKKGPELNVNLDMIFNINLISIYSIFQIANDFCLLLLFFLNIDLNFYFNLIIF